MLESTVAHKEIRERDKLILGYSLMRKSKSEVYNYISPTLRVLRFTEGEAELIIDGTVHCYRQGDIVLLSNLNKRNIHKIYTETVTYEVFEFYPSCISDERLWGFFYQDVHKAAEAGGEAGRLHSLLDMLRGELAEKRDEFQLFSIQKLLDLLALELKRHMAPGADLRLDSALFQISRSVQYIAEHFRGELTVEALAERCGYSLGYYTRLFKKYIGVPPRYYLMELRLENAIRLRNSRQMTVMEAARQSGFANSSAFYKAFHAYKNTTPGRYSPDTEPLT